MTDGREVFERARSGDRDAFAALIKEYDEGLRTLAFRLLGDRDRMDDVLQEAYLSAFRALPRFRDESNIGTWLYRIVYNECLDELKRRSRRPALPLSEVVEPDDPRSEIAESVGRRRDLATALAALSAEDRAAVLLVDAQGFSYREAGAMLGVREGTVASRLNRARAALRAALEVRTEGLSGGRA